ncbi:glycosyltransferase family 2 protein [Candidatus Saccharibacteria bacterium]|nr:glycosyltransferase family 2 protein [Candidatus Saccharibacteria bacterium]
MKKASSTGKKNTVKKPVFDGPLVSIVMPAYNAEKFIDDTIHSVLGQSYENWELIIVDDASTDKTLEVVRQFGCDKIRVITCKRNGGAMSATNRGIRAARGKYLAFIDANDVWQPNKLKRQLSFMVEKETGFSFASYIYADAKGRPKGRKVRIPEVVEARQGFKDGLIMTSTVMLDMKVVSKADVKMEQNEKKWMRALEKAGRACGMCEVMAIRGYDPGLSFFEKMRRGVR